MKTKNIVIIIAVLALATLVLIGGGCGKKAENGKEKGATESLTDILGKAKSVASYKYDMVTIDPEGAAQTMKMWWKGTKIRMEGTFDGKSMVYLVKMDKQSAYIYFPAENMAMKLGLGKAQESIGESPAEQSGSIMKYNPVTLGTETLDGKKCLVTEYTAETGKTKMWLWTKYGLPIKTELTTAKGTYVTELKNIEFSGISDSMFELPAGVQIMQMPSF